MGNASPKTSTDEHTPAENGVMKQGSTDNTALTQDSNQKSDIP